MDGKLPNFIAIEINKHYASVLTKPEALLGYVGAKEENIYTPVTKIEVERAKNDSSFVHLRFCYDNRYLALADGGNWLVACSDQPEEDEKKRSCTLFELQFSASPRDALHLMHAQTKEYVQFKHHECKSCQKEKKSECKDCNCFYLDKKKSQLRYKNWDSLVMLPKYVAFKGDNGKYLKCRLIREQVVLQFSSDDRKKKETAFEVTMNSCGYLYIKSMCFNKYMCLTDNLEGKTKWICADSTDSETHISRRFLFEAVRGPDDETISLRLPGGNYCCRFTGGRYTDCFAASATDIDPRSVLKVEELVREREIDNLSYQLDKARIYDQKPIVLDKSPTKVRSNDKATSTFEVKYKDVKIHSFKSILGANVGDCTTATATVTAGIPVIAKDKAKISMEVSAGASALSFKWNTETKTERDIKEEAYQATLKPGRSARVNYVATEGKIDVPFHYTQKSTLSIDGTVTTEKTNHTDGVFSGVNYHSFHFEEKPY